MNRLNMDSRVIDGVYMSKLLQIAEDEGLSSDDILQKVNLNSRDFLNSNSFFSFREFYNIVDEMEADGLIPGLGLKLSEREGPLTTGMLGYAVVASPNLETAFKVYERYQDHIGIDVKVALTLRNDTAILTASEYFPLGKYLRFAIEECFGNWLFYGEQLQGGRLRLKSAHFSYPSPEYAYKYTDKMRCPVKFDEPYNQLRFNLDFLDVPFVTANEAIHRICASHCESMYKRHKGTSDIAEKVRRSILNSPTSPPQLNEIASWLQMSPRTLRRYLQMGGTSYQEILFDVRMNLAADSLRFTVLTPDEISYLIGYSEVASFYRNFKRWCGQTPLEYRNSVAT